MNKLVAALSVVIVVLAAALGVSYFMNGFSIPTVLVPPNTSITMPSPKTATIDRTGLAPEALQVGRVDLLPPTSSDITLQDLFSRVQGSVVQIVDNSASSSSSSTLGSGFVYDDNGHIVTNNHVVNGGGTLDVTFLDGTIYRAKVIGSDPYSDLAVLYVESAPKDKLVPLPLADSTKLRVGQEVAAVGNPFGLSGSMTSGIVSGLGRSIPDQQAGQFAIPDVIQTDAAVNPGNSGGPLLDMRAEVIGVNSAIYTGTGQFSGVGFAVPSDTISKVIPALITSGSYKHPWLGITGRDMTPGLADALGLKEPKGFLVIDTVKGSPADQAGIRGGTRDAVVDGNHIMLGGDVIIQVDGNDVRKIDDILVYLQREKSVGDPLKLLVLRDGASKEITVTLGARPSTLESP